MTLGKHQCYARNISVITFVVFYTLLGLGMFVEIINESFRLPDGNVLETLGYALLLNVEGQEVSVPIEELTNVEVDEEDMDKARNLYVTYQEQDYQFPLPDRDSRDWAILEEMFHPE